MHEPDLTTTEKVLASFGPPPTRETGDCEAQVARLAEEMTRAWRRGERPGAEHYLDRHPDLAGRPAAVMDLLFEEISLRHQYDEPVDVDDIVRRFPAWKQQIEVLVQCVYTLETGVMGGYPSAGDTLGDFELVTELGRGGLGRVYLATQSSLGGRPVVLKITPRGGQEHLSLARLQHTHIVPLLSVLDEPDRNLRVLCMPYFGGLTLAAILAALKKCPHEQRSGARILEVLDEARAGAAVLLPPGRDPTFLRRASYVQAISWISACLAEALKYAHERGLVHLDLKPSNVLLTADRQPMLLDFHLAREPLAAGDLAVALGGTALYMSPEQKRAMTILRKGAAAQEAIDGRSDIYSLGLVMHEALGGKIPSEHQATPAPIQECNRQVPVGLADIIAKCLAPAAKNRYRDAGALAADLWNHLNDLPLKGVANRSLPERWRKWRRRKPHMLSLYGLLAAVFAVAAAAVAFALMHFGPRVDEAALDLAAGQKQFKSGQYPEAMSTWQRGLSQLAEWPGNQELKDKLTHNVHLATRAKAAQDLHHIADRFRFAYGVDPRSSPGFQGLAAHCAAFWEKRNLILDRLGRELDTDIEQRVQLDLLDLAILGCNLRAGLADKGREAGVRLEALQMLDQAEALFGPSAVLYHERHRHAEALGRFDEALQAKRRAANYPPRTAWECYALGRALMQDDDLEGAAVELERAVDLEPNGLWSNFYQGICSYRLGRFEDAAMAFTACTVLAPQSAGCFYNRALALTALGRSDRALRDFERASKLDPGFADAHADASQLLKTPRK
jgi:serine/threonine protein kinase